VRKAKRKQDADNETNSEDDDDEDDDENEDDLSAALRDDDDDGFDAANNAIDDGLEELVTGSAKGKKSVFAQYDEYGLLISDGEDDDEDDEDPEDPDWKKDPVYQLNIKSFLEEFFFTLFQNHRDQFIALANRLPQHAQDVLRSLFEASQH